MRTNYGFRTASISSIASAFLSLSCSAASDSPPSGGQGATDAAGGTDGTPINAAPGGSGGATSAPGGSSGGSSKVPLLITADIYYPPDDLDDHVDLAVALQSPLFNIRGLVLDGGHPQQVERGEQAMRMLRATTDRELRLTRGLETNLTSLTDQVRGDSTPLQAGVELIIEQLQANSEPLTIVTQGSLRDVAAAYNREPELFHEKLERLVIFIGDASENLSKDSYSWTPNAEWNVRLDPIAYARILSSGLPVYWVPCFEGGQGSKGENASYWHARGRALVHGNSGAISQSLQAQLFLVASQSYYANGDGLPFDRNALGALDPVEFVEQPLDEAYATWFDGLNVQMWIGALYLIAGHQSVIRDDGWEIVPEARANEGLQTLFGFEPVDVTVSDDGLSLTYGPGPDSQTVQRFQIRAPRDEYEQVMTQLTYQLMTR